jgi:regulation of enolase protein 1 (concanavalin A-like superfamily)
MSRTWTMFLALSYVVWPALAAEGPPAYHTLLGWGQVIDPEGDCSFRLEKDQVVIAIPGKDHALAVERGQMNAPRILQELTGDFVAQVRVGGLFGPPAESVVEGRRAFQGAGLLLCQDDNNYLRLERAVLVADGQAFHYASFEIRKDGKCLRFASASDLPLSDRDTLLRLERRDKKIVAAVSQDGAKWNSLEPIADDWPSKLQIGVGAGHNTGVPFAPSFSQFKLSR